MTVKEFVNKVANREINLQSVSITTDYISYGKKLEVCSRIINSTCYIKNELTQKRELHISSPSTHILYMMNLVELYTDMEVNYSNMVEEYDLLKKNEIMSRLLNLIPIEERQEFDMILEMTKNDLEKNEYQVGAYIKNRLDNATTILGTSLEPVMDKLLPILENLDEDKIAKIVKSLDGKKVNIFEKFTK